jgi:prepilin signal peptidase PulO-like enzyme (type II secretory pathway)
MFDPDSISRLILPIASGAIGASIGSFLNVCIYRIPIGLTVTQPRRSFCPRCRHQVEARDNIPIFSWLWLRGRCRFCKSPISIWYFLIELLGGLGATVACLKGGIAAAGGFLLLFSLLSFALRTARNGFRTGPLLLTAVICATSLVLIQRDSTLATNPVPTLASGVAGLLIASRWTTASRIDWKLQLVIVLAALAAGWLAAFASALLIYAATKITTFSKRFPGLEDAILLLAVCLGPLMMF